MKKWILCFLAAVMVSTTAFAADWDNGNMVTAENGHSYTYDCDSDGSFSTAIGEDGITWLYVSYLNQNSENRYCWFGIENDIQPNGTRAFPEGSRFSIRLITRDSAEWSKIDTDTLGENAKAFELCIEAPDGRFNDVFENPCQLYISGDYQVSGMDEENVPLNRIPMNASSVVPETSTYTVCTLRHTGIYFMRPYDDDFIGSVLNEPGTAIILIVIGAAVIVSIVILVLRRKRNAAKNNT